MFIRVIHRNRELLLSFFGDDMNYCDNFNGVMISYDKSKNTTFLSVSRCKSWYCEYCAVKNKRRWRAVIIDAINRSGKKWSWFTLTAKGNSHKAPNSNKCTLDNLANNWDRFVKRLRRRYGSFSYVRVYEKHNSGNYHLHCLCSFWFDDIKTRRKGTDKEYNDSPELRKIATDCGYGYMTHADNIDGHGGYVAGYITKYMTKMENEQREDFGRVRRIQTSRDIKYKSVNTELEWRHMDAFYLDDMSKELGLGHEVWNLNENRHMSFDDFESTNIYPPTKKCTDIV